MTKTDNPEVGIKPKGFEELSGEFLELVGRNKLWIFNCAIITAIATLLRFVFLELKPLHHDEGVNGHFLITLFREGVYQYNPANYHGPDLYYISLTFAKVFGLNTLSVRSSVAIFGVLTVVLAFFLRRYIGTIGSLAAALFLAISPGMVYISRYFIHEILFVFFSLSFVVAILFFIEKRRAGMFAAGWMTLLLFVSFLPTALPLAGYVGGENQILVWILKVAIFFTEAVFVFFVMRMLLAWDHGRPIYFMLVSASLIMLFATKETAFVTIGTMIIAGICVWGWRKVTALEGYVNRRTKVLYFIHGVFALAAAIIAYIFFERLKGFYQWFYTVFASPDVPDQRFLFYAILLLSALGIITWILFFLGTKGEVADSISTTKFFEPTFSKFSSAFGDGNKSVVWFAAILVFSYIGVLFFSSFFTYSDGVKGAAEAYAIWTKTGSKDHTQNGTIAYIKWMAQLESPLIVLSILGTLIAFLKARHRFAMFAGLWAFGLFLAYTIIPYKTPWLALSFTLPMCIIGGYAVNELAVSKQLLHKVLAGILGLLSVFILTYQAYDLNFVRYDSDRMPYVYAHTTRGFLDLIGEIDRYAEKSGLGKEATIEIVSEDYWPMPWYTKDYSKANYHGKIVDANTSEMIVAGEKQRDELSERFAAHYKYVGAYPLRPGVKLYLLVRKDIAGPEAKEMGDISVD